MSDDPHSLRLDPELTRVDEDAFVAPDAVVLGDVWVGRGASVWFKAVVRGDAEAIEIGEGSNVQDHCTLHADPGYPCRLGRGVTVGHRAIVHGATIEDGAMVGMGAIVMNGARVGAGAILGRRRVAGRRQGGTARDVGGGCASEGGPPAHRAGARRTGALGGPLRGGRQALSGGGLGLARARLSARAL